MGRLMCVFAEFSPEDVLPLRGDSHALFTAGDFPISVYMNDSRYRVFSKSLTCCRCGLVGTIMRLEYYWHPKGWADPHFNLYAPDDRLSTSPNSASFSINGPLGK